MSERAIAALAGSFAAWRGPDPRWRDALAGELPRWSRAVVERGVREGLADWTAEALSALWAREGRAAPRSTAVWLADTPPTGVFAALALPLLAGCRVHAKPSSADPCSPRLFLESLRECDASIAERLSLDADADTLERAEAVVAYGSDETIAELRARARGRLFVGYGHKLSAAAIGPGADLAAAAARVALDACLWDGRGCLSPAWIWVDGAARAAEFADALAAELERASRVLPRGSLSDSEQVALRERRASEALACERALLSDATTEWGVFLGGRSPGSLRNLPVIAIDGADDLAARCAALVPHLSCLGHEGFEGVDLDGIAARGGGSRTCIAGHMQLPPIDWPHDGRGALQPVFEDDTADGEVNSA